MSEGHVRPRRLRTPRLELVAADAELARADADGDRLDLADLLAARVPEDWPPALTADALARRAETLEAHPDQAGWWNWYFVRDEPDWGERVLVGSGGFGGPPDEDGVVQTGYSVLASFQLKGFATEAMRALVAWAFDDARVQQIVAETYPDLVPSVGVIAKLGMTYLRDGEEAGCVRFGLDRAAYGRRSASWKAR